jgi:hypothetical protein
MPAPRQTGQGAVAGIENVFKMKQHRRRDVAAPTKTGRRTQAAQYRKTRDDFMGYLKIVQRPEDKPKIEYPQHGDIEIPPVSRKLFRFFERLHNKSI